MKRAIWKRAPPDHNYLWGASLEQLEAAMPRYFFSLTNGKSTCHDFEGKELPGDKAARQHAIKDARYLLRSRIAGVKAEDHWRVEVTDGTGHMVMVVPFVEAAGVQHRH